MELMSGMVYNKVKNSNMTIAEILLDWLGKNYYYIGNDLLEKVEELKQMEIDQAEKLKDFDTWKEWKNKTN